MKKRNNIIYWIATLWLSLGMVSTGIVQVLGIKEEVAFILNLGYPEYLLTLLGLSKLLGVVAILIPKFPKVKEWAYAGFTFTMAGALYSHLVKGSPVTDILPVILLLTLIFVSWYFRPVGRKTVGTITE